MRFYLGVHRPEFLYRDDDFFVGRAAFDGVRLFVSANRLRDRKVWPASRVDWALDSGGFSEIAANHGWTVSPGQYVDEVYRWFDQLGPAEWCAPQDWMCEPHMLAKTRKTVREHQKLTTANYMTLRRIAPDLPFVPVLQGWTVFDYLRHADDYRKAGVELSQLSLVGVGSVCRRQSTKEAENIMRTLVTLGIRIHGFGFKIDGIRKCGDVMESADSMAWSFGARRSKPLPHCTHKNCANCHLYALKWYREKIEPLL